jgi:hypothetical protein
MTESTQRLALAVSTTCAFTMDVEKKKEIKSI